MAFNYVNSSQKNGNNVSNNIGTNKNINQKKTQIISSFNNSNVNPVNTRSKQTSSSYSSYNQSSMNYTNDSTQEKVVFRPNNHHVNNNQTNQPNISSQQTYNPQTEGHPSHNQEQKMNKYGSTHNNSGYGGNGGYNHQSMGIMNKSNGEFGYRYLNQIRSNADYFKVISTTNKKIIVMFYNKNQKYSVLLLSTIGIVSMKHREIELLTIEISDAPNIHEMYGIYLWPSLIMLKQNGIDVAERLYGLSWIVSDPESLGNVNGEYLEQKLIEHRFLSPIGNYNFALQQELSTNANENTNRLLMGFGDDADKNGMTQGKDNGDDQELDIID